VTRRALVGGLVAVAALAAAAYYVQQRDVRQGRHRAADLVFPFNTTRVVALTVEVEDRRATLQRNDSGVWTAEEGGDAGGAADLAPDVIGSWGRIRFLDVVEEEPEDLGRYGLDRPRVHLTARLRPGSQDGTLRREIEIGGPNPLQPSFYARVDGFPRVVLVSAQAAELEYLARRLLGLPVEEPPSTDELRR